MTTLVLALNCWFVKIKIHNWKREADLYPTVICAT
jgi:hypothetical protein